MNFTQDENGNVVMDEASAKAKIEQLGGYEKLYGIAGSRLSGKAGIRRKMRAIPGMVVLSPADAVETKKMVFAAAEYEGPVYIRMGRLDVETIFDEETYDFQIGIANTVREGNDVTIAATGLMTYEAIKAADILAQEGISVRVINVGTIKPLDGETILKAAKETKFIITAEEHSVIGGLGSAVSEFLSEVYPTKVKKLGIYDKFGQSGKAAELLEKYELTAAKLVAMVKENM